MSKEKVEMKTFNMKITKEIWLFLKRTALTEEVSMTEIVNTCIEKYKKQMERKGAQTE